MNMNSRKSRCTAALAAFIVLAVLAAPALAEETSADGSYYYYTINTDGTVSGTYQSIGATTAGNYVSVNNANSGSWTFNSDGIGPFNSFYAAFDPYNDNAFVCILDPDDLSRSIDGEDISEHGYNIMWVIPTVYWYTDDDGNLTLTNDPSEGSAYAHTVNGDTYDYLAIGVYEASTLDVNGETALASVSGAEPVTGNDRATYRGWANSQAVENGEAMVWNLYQYELYKYCATIVIGSWSSQSVAGNGNVSSGTASTTGSLDSSGPYAGNTESYTDSVKVFIENAWGSVGEMVDGVMVYETRKTFYVDTSSSPTDSVEGTYVSSVTASLASTGWGGETSTTLKVWGLPTSNDGSESTGTCDYVVSSTGVHILVVGGDSEAEDGAMYGLSYIDGGSLGLNASSDTVGTRLAFVYDADDDGESSDDTLMYVAIAAIVVAAAACVAYYAYRTGRI